MGCSAALLYIPSINPHGLNPIESAFILQKIGVNLKEEVVGSSAFWFEYRAIHRLVPVINHLFISLKYIAKFQSMRKKRLVKLKGFYP